jgi:hypothetical protein
MLHRKLNDFGGSYFYCSYYLISVKHHKIKISKDTDYAALNFQEIRTLGVNSFSVHVFVITALNYAFIMFMVFT